MRTLVLGVFLAATFAETARADSASRPPRSVQQSTLQQILRGFPETNVSGRVSAPAREWAPRSHSWISFKIRPRNTVEQVHQTWQTSVTAGLLAGISKSRGWRPVAGASITLVLANGKERFQSEGILGGAFRGGIDHVAEAEAERLLRESAANVGARVVSVRFPRPLGRLAAEVVVATDRPQAFADRSLANLNAIAEALWRRAEGVYVEVRTIDGRWVAALGRSVRTSSGTAVVNPDFR